MNTRTSVRTTTDDQGRRVRTVTVRDARTGAVVRQSTFEVQ